MEPNREQIKKDLTRELKKVIITGKTYTEYIDALADHLISRYCVATNENRCVICFETIPEGRQLCPNCEKKGWEKL